MKKISIMLGALILSAVSYSAQVEVKAGFEPWREANNSHVNYNEGGSLGAEVLFEAGDSFVYGLGAEWKTKFKGEDYGLEKEATAFPVYLTGKYSVGNDLFYLVGRAGWAFYENADGFDGFYGGVGVGKMFGNFSVEALYESMDLVQSSKMYSGERIDLASVKVGYRFGGGSKRVEYVAPTVDYSAQDAEAARLAEEARRREAARLEAERLAKQRMARAQKLGKYNSLIISNNYNVNKLNTDSINRNLLEEMKRDLADERGVLAVRGYTDSDGSVAYNQKLSQKRADKIANVIREELNNENIEVISEGLGETNFLNGNSNKKEKRLNRRVEVDFMPRD